MSYSQLTFEFDLLGYDILTSELLYHIVQLFSTSFAIKVLLSSRNGADNELIQPLFYIIRV